MTSTFGEERGRRGGGVRQKYVIGRREFWTYNWTPNLYLFFIKVIKENRICAMTRHHVEPNTNILSAADSEAIL